MQPAALFHNIPSGILLLPMVAKVEACDATIVGAVSLRQSGPYVDLLLWAVNSEASSDSRKYPCPLSNPEYIEVSNFFCVHLYWMSINAWDLHLLEQLGHCTARGLEPALMRSETNNIYAVTERKKERKKERKANKLPDFPFILKLLGILRMLFFPTNKSTRK